LQWDSEPDIKKIRQIGIKQVVAKGMRRVAERIREIGKKHGIPIVENKPLAQTLYKEVEIDQTIPINLYQAVAKILAYIYQIKNKRF
jgi:flagellar biosynthesis protein FlhB